MQQHDLHQPLRAGEGIYTFDGSAFVISAETLTELANWYALYRSRTGTVSRQSIARVKKKLQNDFHLLLSAMRVNGAHFFWGHSGYHAEYAGIRYPLPGDIYRDRELYLNYTLTI